MRDKKKYSILIRVICGLLGVLGIAATAFNALSAQEFVFEFKLVAIAFACFIFIYVGATGKNPLDSKKSTEIEK